MDFFVLKARRQTSGLITFMLLTAPRQLHGLVLCFLIAAGNGCASRPSQREENLQSQQTYREILRSSKAQGRLNPDPLQHQYVAGIAGRLIVEAGILHPPARHWNWQINIVSSPELNAFCFPGGQILIYSGFLEQLQANETDLAAILSHEIAHALLQHGQSRVAAQQSFTKAGHLVIAASVLAGMPPDAINPFMSAQQQASSFLANQIYGPGQEREADELGLRLMIMAHYSPQGMIHFWKKMAARSQPGTVSPFGQTHPSHQSRLDHLQSLVSDEAFVKSVQ